MTDVNGAQGGAVPLEEIRARQETLRHLLAGRGLRAALAVGRGFFDRPGSFAYFTGHIPPFISAPFDRPNGGAGLGVAVIPADGDVVVIEMFPTRPELIATDDVRVSSTPVAETINVLRELRLDGAVGIVDGDLLPWTFARLLGEALPNLELVPFDPPVARLRSVKSAAEIEALRRAARVADAGLAVVRENVIPGSTEREVCTAGIAEAMRCGADFIRYLRVHSGPWSLIGARWPQATDRVLREGEYVAADIIGTRQGYGFDVLRCFVAGGSTPQQRRLTDAAAAVTQAVISECRPGAVANDLLAAAKKSAERLGYGDCLDGFIGHGIGLETVEWPLLTAEEEWPLEPGMVLCIEPALLAKGIGGARIEEEIVVTEDEPEVLTSSSRSI